MGEQRRIHAQTLTASDFEPFGRAVGLTEGRSADVGGEGWACWCPVGALQDEGPLEIGLVRSEARPLVVEALERHLDREEFVYALEQPVIQVVALTSPGGGAPDATSAKAFLVLPGQGVIMAPGVWHGVGLPAGERAITYGFILAEAGEEPGAGSPWVTFAEGEVLRIDPRPLDSTRAGGAA